MILCQLVVLHPCCLLLCLGYHDEAQAWRWERTVTDVVSKLLVQSFDSEASAARYESWAFAETIAETAVGMQVFKPYVCWHVHPGLCCHTDRAILDQ